MYRLEAHILGEDISFNTPTAQMDDLEIEDGTHNKDEELPVMESSTMECATAPNEVKTWYEVQIQKMRR